MITNYEIEGFNYKSNPKLLGNVGLGFEINYPDEYAIPDYLYKYYSLDELNIDAFLSNYYYSPHPLECNDKYDCPFEIIDFSNLSVDQFVKLSSHLPTYGIVTSDWIKETYSNNKPYLEIIFAETVQNFLFMKLGNISLSNSDRDILMWAYYTGNKGFQIKYNTKYTPRNCILLSPVNYITDLISLTYSQYDTSLLAVIMSNIKFKRWNHEKEWRYLTFNPDGKYHPLNPKKDVEERKHKYSHKAISEVTFGYDFFIPLTELIRKSSDEIHVNLDLDTEEGKNKKKLIDYILERGIKSSITSRMRQEYLLGKQEVYFDKINEWSYNITIGAHY